MGFLANTVFTEYLPPVHHLRYFFMVLGAGQGLKRTKIFALTELTFYWKGYTMKKRHM